MKNGERALRLGIYAGLAAVKLHDQSYAQRFLGRSIADVSDEEFLQVTVEIQQKLIAAGVIRPDEDPFDQALKDFVGRMGEEQVSWMLKTP